MYDDTFVFEDEAANLNFRTGVKVSRKSGADGQESVLRKKTKSGENQVAESDKNNDGTHPGHTIWDRPGYLVRRLHQIHVAMFLEHVADGEITPIQYGLLSILASRPKIDQLTIGEELGLDRANVTDILKRLESRKLITRVVDPENRRRKICLATSIGLALVSRYEQQMQDCQRQLLNPLKPAERKVFMDLLSRLVEGNNESGRTSLKPNGDVFGFSRTEKN